MILDILFEFLKKQSCWQYKPAFSQDSSCWNCVVPCPFRWAECCCGGPALFIYVTYYVKLSIPDVKVKS